MNSNQEPWAQDIVYTRYVLWFVYACVIYSVIGFSWGAMMGGIADFRHFVDGTANGKLIVRAHTHVNLLGWVEMAIFASIYYVVPRLVRRPIYSVALVKAHFWVHNFGLIGMVVLFTSAGVISGMAQNQDTGANLEMIVHPFLATMGIFGSLVLLANLIWGYNIFRTCIGWAKERS